MTACVLLTYSTTVLVLLVSDNCNQACSQRGASDCSAPNINLDGPITNLQNIKDKHAEQPTKKKKMQHLTASMCCLC